MLHLAGVRGASALWLLLMLLQHGLGKDAEGVATFSRATPEAIPAHYRAHRCHFLPHVVNLPLEHLPDLLELVDVGLIVGSERVEQIAHIVAKASDHLFQLIATAFERLPPRLVREYFVDEVASLGHFRDETTQLPKRIDVLFSLHADVSTEHLHPPRWSRVD